MSQSTEARSRFRITPAPWVGVVMAVVYIVVVFGLQLATGLDYDEWTDTSEHGIRAGIIPLGVGAVLLIAFMAWSRWDLLWRDPRRLEMTTAMKVALWFFVLAIVARFAVTEWGNVDLSLLLVTIGIGALVGFAEEMLFRGVVLRSLRTGGRDEARAALWTAIGFGLFHAPNLLIGIGGAQVAQIVIAGLSGVSLYLFRRYRGMIVTAMVAHGIWDVSTFLTLSSESELAAIVTVLLLPFGIVIGIVALVSIWRHDQGVVVASDADTA